MARILSQSDGRVVQRPILAKHKSIEHQLDEEKLELRARKALAAERKKRDDLARVFPQIAANDFEKRLRKVATRGVVKLFNAIRTTQKSVDVVKQDGVQKNASKVTGVAKGSFLQMIRESGEKANPSGVDSQSKAKVGESGGPTNGGEATAAAAVKGSGGKSGTASEGVAWTRDDYLNEEATALQKKSGAWDLDSD
ncbi:Rrp15p-domain-containing protein [Zopfochytrium polystomum]|nr:Rrp15p-domain-containing protein [Zopfochytrium polystomum]